ncbi:MAG TPA: acetate--CoA ligase family protein [Steroidobacteraceae bacterium]|nr:acetate--CoA ligase family protein [Steroidobacteraceae bacterium]
MAAGPLERLLAPRTIALVGGAWTDGVAAAGRRIGYRGETWRVHPTRRSDAETTYYRSVEELPGAPDATFLAAPAADVPGVAAALARRGAGGFVCFASGFDELGTERGRELTRALVAASDGLPFTGPNCYGLINFFDRVALWPDQVVGGQPERGVALLCQSGTISLTMTFNGRSLPIGYLISVGNQSRLAVEDLIEALCEDPRVSAFGLYLEGVKDVARFARAVDRARLAGKPVALLKAGRTAAAARTAATHTGSLAGADEVFDAYCRQAGVARCETLAALCETLKLLHVGGPLPGRRTLVFGHSGGDMAMISDVARGSALEFPPFDAAAAARLRGVVGERVTIANPFDVHTYSWFDRAALRATFDAVLHSGYDVAAYMLDCPPDDRADPSTFVMPISEFIAASQGAPTRAALLAALPETIYPALRERLLAGGVTPLQGQREALEALDLAAQIGAAWRAGPAVELRIPRRAPGRTRTLAENAGKAALAACGLPVPAARAVPPAEAAAAAAAIGFPVVIKALSAELAHKSEVGGVVLNVRSTAEAAAAATRLAALADRVLVEQMVSDGVAEILVGITVDPQFGQVLVLGAGGVLTEYLRDSTSLLPPFTAGAVRAALGRLRVAKLLAGFRGQPPGDVEALVAAVLAVARYAESELESLAELDVNPIIVRPSGHGVVAVDVLIRLTEEH